MEVIRQFVEKRRQLLNAPASSIDLDRSFGGVGSIADSVRQLYANFDGETSWGAWLPGFRICTLREVEQTRAATYDAWDWMEDSPMGEAMRSFFPFIASDRKTRVGPVLFAESELSGAVVEYDFELGYIRIWSLSVDAFIEAFFQLSLKLPVEKLIANEETYEFTGEDVSFLAAWSSIQYPVAALEMTDIDRFEAPNRGEGS